MLKPLPSPSKMSFFTLAHNAAGETTFKVLITGGHGKGCVRAVWTDATWGLISWSASESNLFGWVIANIPHPQKENVVTRELCTYKYLKF